MKIGVSVYSFSQYIKAGKLTQKSAIAKAAELGFDDIEFTELNQPEGISPVQYAKELKEEAEKCGIEISAYVVGANLAQSDISAEIEHLKLCVDTANALGAKLFRHDVMYDYKFYPSFDLALPHIAKGAREITEYAAKYGIKTMTENHGFIAQDSERIERLVCTVNHPNFGTLVDIGNFLCADEASADAVSRVANLAFLVHAKDFLKLDFNQYNNEDGYFKTRGCNHLKGTTVGQGVVPVAQCIEILKNAHYDGYLDIEYEGSEDCIKGLKDGLEFLKKLI